MDLEHEASTEQMIGAPSEVPRRLGPGFLESVKEKSLIVESRKLRLAARHQTEVNIGYDGEQVGRHRLALFVEGTIVVERKAIKNVEDIQFAVALSYPKAVGRNHG